MLDIYLKFKILGFIIPIVIIVLLGLAFLIFVIKFNIDKRFKKNCFDCEHYHLDNVSSAGGICWYRCKKYDRTDKHDFNDDYNLVKCKDFNKQQKG